MPEGRILAIDYGEKRLGLAISDSRRIFSFPVETYSRRTLKEDILFLKELIDLKNVVLLILGNPLANRGEEGFMSKKVALFKGELERELSLPVETFDETCTTSDAEEVLREYGLKEKEMRGKKDALAASFILKSYLESLGRNRD